MSTSCLGRLTMLGSSYMEDGLCDKGEEGLGGELENWLRRSVALRVSWGDARPFRLAVEGVIEASVATERKSLGRRPPELDRIESLRDMPLLRRESAVGEPMVSSSESEV